LKKEKKLRAIVDIDNTLWHFCDILYEELKIINGLIPTPEHWIDWDFWQNYCSIDEFINAINKIHLNQDNKRHLPYPESKRFLDTLKKQGFHITIASHRSENTRIPTERWLKMHGLHFDELHLSYDKTVLFDYDCCFVVDDSPKVLEKAREKQVQGAGLLFPWNKSHYENGYILLDNLDDILNFLLKKF